jgi:sec-independent protein translocase protein TatA
VSILAFMSFSFSEMLVVGLFALLIFGGRLPEVMRNLGRTYAKFRHGMNEVAHPIRQEIRRLDLRAPDTAVPRRPEIPDDGRAEVPPPSAPPTGGGGAADEPPPV